MYTPNYLLFFSFVIFSLCATAQTDIQGHRGARGLFPENSLPGFLAAYKMGVTTLEMDVVITKDKKVVVSHEPWISGLICKDPKGNKIAEENNSFNIYQMKYAKVKKCDCGSIPVERFPRQAKMATEKPLLWNVLKTIEDEVRKTGRPVAYNIELKSSAEGVDIFHPAPDEFTRLVFEVLKTFSNAKITIQSFDIEILKSWKNKYPDFPISLLVENELTWKENIRLLGFNPAIYSPWYGHLTPEDINELHRLGIKVIPWTINEESEMQKLLDWGVDGIITDYPDIALKLIN